MPYADIEVRRAHQREYSRERYRQHRERILARQRELRNGRERYQQHRKSHPCRKCGQTMAGHRMFCDTCRTCHQCGGPIAPRHMRGRNRLHIYCSRDCYHSWRRANHVDPLIGKSCRVFIKNCDQCGRAFAGRTVNALRCSNECRRAHFNDSQRKWQREYQRRTRYTAIRYWAIDDSPEALEVATLYYNLRRELYRGANSGR